VATLNTHHRIEKDSMGWVPVPKEAYYGAQTQRAVENFPISGLRFHPELIHALGLIKYAAAKANLDLKLLDRRRARAILPNGLRDLDQHERQRGDCQSCQ
jgi:fumarate hydratase class II